MNVAVPAHAPAARPGRQLPAGRACWRWSRIPMTRASAWARSSTRSRRAARRCTSLCYTHGEASTLNETRADLRRAGAGARPGWRGARRGQCHPA